MLAHELAHVRNRDILIGSVAAAVATAISFIANMAMWGAMFGGGRDDDEGANPHRPARSPRCSRRSPPALLQMALSRSREFEADRTGADADRHRRAARPGAREARGLRQRVPMDIAAGAGQAFIVNPLTGRKVSFANLFRTHPTTEERVARLRVPGPRRRLIRRSALTSGSGRTATRIRTKTVPQAGTEAPKNCRSAARHLARGRRRRTGPRRPSSATCGCGPGPDSWRTGTPAAASASA